MISEGKGSHRVVIGRVGITQRLGWHAFKKSFKNFEIKCTKKSHDNNLIVSVITDHILKMLIFGFIFFKILSLSEHVFRSSINIG